MSAIDRKAWLDSRVSKVQGNQPTPCWEWTKCRTEDGYGRIGNDKAHIVAWKLYNGEFEKGLHVLHKCDNPPCCNPEHLFLGTQKDNRQDAMLKGRLVGPYVGTLNGRSKLNEDAVMEILRLHKSRYDTIPLAKRFGVNPITIRRVINRENWTHISS